MIKSVLFLCTGNSCRSQMAEGFAKNMFFGEINVFSAGTDPKGIHPLAIKVMQEVRVDISGQKSEDLSEIPVDDIDLLVTLCGNAAENCPTFPRKVKRVHWALDDPANATGTEDEIVAAFRTTRDLIKNYIEKEPELKS